MEDKTFNFIDKAKKIHGDKYDYSKVEYINNSTKVCIICPIHGEFWQTPNGHLRGRRCPKCSGNIKKTTQQFIEEAKRVHGDKYDYSKVEYINAKTKVCIICPEHGEFWIKPDNFINGKESCRKCSSKKAIIKQKLKVGQEFIRQCKEKYGDKFLWDKIVYNGKKEKTKFYLNDEEYVEMFPDNFLKSKALFKPKKIKIKKTKDNFFRQNEFIEKSKKIHGDKYDYSKVNYINNKTKVCIICPEHGEFWVTPLRFLSKKYKGCPFCLKEKNREKQSISFLEKAKEIHGDKYDYSKVNYINSSTKVCIICPEHGEFWQSPNAHIIAKHDCPKCAGRKLSKNELIKKYRSIHGDKYDYTKFNYINAHTKSIVICSKHGEFLISHCHHMNGEGCPKCKQSLLEKEISIMLEKNNIDYIQDKPLDFLKKQRPDFYIPQINTIIECQGKQHFECGDYYFGTTNIKEKFHKTIKYDIKKNVICKNNNIYIIYYTTSNNVCNDYLTNKKFGGIYTKENVFFKKEEVLDFLLQKFKNRE